MKLPDPVGIWLCYGLEPARRVAELMPPVVLERLPLTLVTPICDLEPWGSTNRERGLAGEPCRLEVFTRDDEMTQFHGRGRRVFYGFDRVVTRALSPRERAALREETK